MNETKHTPGPWKIYTSPSAQWVGKDITGEIVCEKPDQQYDRANWQANAHLIAAAPDMLEALKAIEPMTWNDSPLLKVYAKEIEQLRAAIAKATA